MTAVTRRTGSRNQLRIGGKSRFTTGRSLWNWSAIRSRRVPRTLVVYSQVLPVLNARGLSKQGFDVLKMESLGTPISCMAALIPPIGRMAFPGELALQQVKSTTQPPHCVPFRTETPTPGGYYLSLDQPSVLDPKPGGNKWIPRKPRNVHTQSVLV